MYPSRKEIILSRSFADASMQDSNAIIQVISDDDENESEKNNYDKQYSTCHSNKISNHQLNDGIVAIQRLDKLKTDGYGGNSESGENYHTAPFKKRKIENIFQNNSNNLNKPSTDQNQDKSEEESEYEIIEVESVSSNDRNTRLKSNKESSSEFIVSSSSKSFQQPMRPRLKNTIPIDNFERCLNNIIKKYPEMTHEERVISWKYSNDVSDVEDCVEFEQNYEKINDRPSYKAQQEQLQQQQRQPPRIQIENRINNNVKDKKITILKVFDNEKSNNCNKTLNSSFENDKMKFQNSHTKMDSFPSVQRENFINDISKGEDGEEEDGDHACIIFNTQTKESKIEKKQKKLPATVQIQWSNLGYSDSENSEKNGSIKFQNTGNLRNRIIQSRAVYKRNIDSDNKRLNELTKIRTTVDSNKMEQFKIPIVPSKYSTSPSTVSSVTETPSVTATAAAATTTALRTNGSTQKEELIKYLGLKTKSQNRQNNNENNLMKLNKIITPGSHFTRLQKEKITKLKKFDCKLTPTNNLNSIKKREKKSTTNKKSNNLIAKVNKHRKMKSSKNNSRNQKESKVKLVFQPFSSSSSTSSPLPSSNVIKPRRSCGCIINSENSEDLSSTNQIGNIKDVITMVNENEMETKKKSEKLKLNSKSRKRKDDSTVTSKSETIESSKSNSWIIMRHTYKHQISEYADKLKKLPFFRDLSKTIMPSMNDSLGNHHNQPKRLTLFEESKTNSVAAELHNKLLEMINNHHEKMPCKILILMRNFESVEEEEAEQEEQMNTAPIENDSPLLQDNYKSPVEILVDHSCSEDSSSPLFQCEVQLINDDDNNGDGENVAKNSSNIDPIPSCSYDYGAIDEKSDKNVIPSECLQIDNKNKRERKFSKFNKIKMYSKLLKNKSFIRFLKRNQSIINKNIFGNIRMCRQGRFNLKPKKNLIQILNSGNRSDDSILSPIHITKDIDTEEECIEVDIGAQEGCIEIGVGGRDDAILNKKLPMKIANKIKEKTDAVIDENIIEEKCDQKGNEESSELAPTTATISSSIQMQKTLTNPLSAVNGSILHVYYEQNLLIVVQELLISFWKYSKITQMMAKTQEWILIGEYKRKIYDEEISTPYKNRLCISDANPVYVEMRGRQFPKDNIRECNMASVYVNVYHYNESKSSVIMFSVQLDTIKGCVNDIIYTSITNSRYFIMCWKQEGVLGTTRTGICKYALTPDLDTLASIREFKNMRHTITHLDCINDEKLIGFGQSQITIWDHRTGDVLTNFDLDISLGKNLGSVLNSMEHENYLFLYQIRTNEKDRNKPSTSKDCDNDDTEFHDKPPELKILALSITHLHPKFRLIHSHELPKSFTNIKSSICTGDYLIVTADENNDELLLLPHQPEQIYFMKNHHSIKSNDTNNRNNIRRFYTTGSYNFIELTDDTLVVKTIHHYLLNFTN